MVMDQFVTTYRKDYLWPYVRAIGLKPEPATLFRAPSSMDHGAMCRCKCTEQQPVKHVDKVLGPNALKLQEWSRLAPMGPLLDPKLYPSKVGAVPESQEMRYNQPNVFMKKLQQKYPFIYEILRTAPPDDQITRINKDRLLSTYQVDYCKIQEYPSAPYDELLRSAGVQGLPSCPESVVLPGDPYRPNERSVPFRPNVAPKRGGLRKTSGGGIRSSGGAAGVGGGIGGGTTCGCGIIAWNPYDKDREIDLTTEKWGMMIYRDTLHVHGKGRLKNRTRKAEC